jgi:hypothetical protein
MERAQPNAHGEMTLRAQPNAHREIMFTECSGSGALRLTRRPIGPDCRWNARSRTRTAK